MSKFMKFWTLIICLLFIFLIIFTDRVNAETFTNSNMSANFTINFTKTITNTFQQEIINSTNGNDFQWNGDYKYLYIYYGFTHMLANENITSSNINYSITCASYNQSWDLNEYGTITYQDGSTATIDYLSWTKYCEQWTTQGQDFTKPNINNTPNILVTIVPRSGLEVNCFTYDSYIKCPISNVGKKIKSIKIGLWGRTSYSTNYNFRMFSNVWLTNDNEEISVIEQQTQQQHNDAQQQYNFISNTTIDSNTTSNVNNIDTSNSDTKNAVTNFALIPLNFMQSIINSFSSSCSQVCIGECGGSNGGGHDNAWRFIFPCLDIESIVGSNIYGLIDSLFAFGMVFAFIRSVRKFFINALLLTTDASSEVGVFL